MSRALVWIRKSKGSDDAIGLEMQRADVRDLAEELAEEMRVLDLGIQSGFSSMTREGDGLLDSLSEVKDAVEDLRKGRFDYLVAWDDQRICRDEYYEVIKYAAKEGGAELVFVADVEKDDLTHDLKRRVERHTKEEEIEKSRRAVERRIENGYDHGRPRFGMTYDDRGEYQVPGEEFDTVIDIFQADNSGLSLREISDRVGVPVSTVRNVLDRREWYVEREQMAET